MSYSTEVVRGVDLWSTVAKKQIEIIRTSGPIQTNDKRMWQQLMDPLTDQDWFDMLTAFHSLNQEHGHLISLDEYQVWLKAVEQLDQYRGVLKGDAPGHSCMNYIKNKRKPETLSTKKKSWQMIMVMREVWCRACGIIVENK
jgi:hypothetical protein